jgi:hypothetical protein
MLEIYDNQDQINLDQINLDQILYIYRDDIINDFFLS